MSLLEICEWIQNTPSSTAIRESLWVFPIIEGSHVLALGLSVGTVLWFDLRLMGVAMQQHTVSEAFDHVRKWMLLGFTIMFVTGGLLFWSLAERCYVSGYFLLKLILLALAGINVAVYHFTIDRTRDQWGKAPVPPLQARIVGFISIVLWAGVIAAGRIMAYTF
jgi:Family of unknown function (DUF6644)